MGKKIQKDDIDHFMDNDIYIPTRTLYVGSHGSDEYGNESGTDYLMAERTWKGLHILDHIDANGNKTEKKDRSHPIIIIMNNIGGDEYHGMGGIYDAIADCKNHVTIKIYGYAASMGSIVVHSADDILMSQNSRMLLHYGTVNCSPEAHAKDTYAMVEEAKKFDKLMETIYLNRIKAVKPKFTLKKVQEMIIFDKWLDAEQALALNLIDGIIINGGDIKRRDKGE